MILVGIVYVVGLSLTLQEKKGKKAWTKTDRLGEFIDILKIANSCSQHHP